MPDERRPHAPAAPEPPKAPSGLDLMRAALAGGGLRAPIAEVLDFELAAVGEGRVTFHGTPSPRHLNPMGTVHGGWYGAILDSAMGCAVMTRLPAGTLYTTLEYKVNILRPIPVGARVVCEGVVAHAGRRTAVATAEIRGAEDGARLFATGSTTCIVLEG